MSLCNQIQPSTNSTKFNQSLNDFPFFLSTMLIKSLHCNFFEPTRTQSSPPYALHSNFIKYTTMKPLKLTQPFMTKLCLMLSPNEPPFANRTGRAFSVRKSKWVAFFNYRFSHRARQPRTGTAKERSTLRVANTQKGCTKKIPPPQLHTTATSNTQYCFRVIM